MWKNSHLLRIWLDNINILLFFKTACVWYSPFLKTWSVLQLTAYKNEVLWRCIACWIVRHNTVDDINNILYIKKKNWFNYSTVWFVSCTVYLFVCRLLSLLYLLRLSVNGSSVTWVLTTTVTVGLIKCGAAVTIVKLCVISDTRLNSRKMNLCFILWKLPDQ